MKKTLLTLAMMLGAVGVYADNKTDIKMYMGGSLIEPGTHAFNEMTVDKNDGVTIDPGMYIISDTKKSKVTIKAINKTGQKIQLCAGGECEIKEEVTKTVKTLDANKKLNLLFEYCNNFITDAADVPANITTDIIVEYKNNQDVYTIVMNDKTGGVTVLEQDKDIYATSEGLVYNLSAPSNISVYDLNGARVLSSDVNGSGTLTLQGLPKGLYLYSVNGAASISGKVMVK